MVSAYFLDTSALVKRYIDETGSAWLRAIVDPALNPFLVISQLLVVEVHSLATALTSNRLLSDSGLPALTFLCADDRLLDAATAEGLATDNPNCHQ
jgi:hypothetical protein